MSKIGVASPTITSMLLVVASATSSGPAVAAAASPPAEISVVNRTRDVIREVHLSPTSDDGWGIGRLHDVLQPGETVTIPLPERTCRYDVAVVLESWAREKLFTVDLCASSRLVVHGTGDVVDPRRCGISSPCRDVTEGRGRFEVSYTPIMCVRAPCPPGHHDAVTLDGARAGARRLDLAGVPQRWKALFERSNLLREPVAIEGDFRVDPASGTLFIQATDARLGRWKHPRPTKK